MITYKDISKDKESVNVIPLGGLGDIGMNCMLMQTGDECIMVDCGQMMPDEEMLGVDSVIPDFSYLEENPQCLKAIVLTHAHEDHVGALAYILPNFPEVPIYGTELTIALLEEKLREYRLKPNFVLIEPRETYKLSESFSVEPISVTHSIIDAVALAIRTPLGVIVHTGDFKIDPHPPDGIAFDHYSFAKYGEDENGVLLLLSDSTNVSRHGNCPSEMEVVPGLDQIFRNCEGSVIVSTFSSSLHRIQNLLNIAAKHGRTVIPFGLNMERNIRIAHRINAIDIPCNYLSSSKQASEVSDEERLIICTGSQGEPMSSLSRMSQGNHRDYKIKEGDTVILSARMIPGNESAIYRMMNHLSRRGAKILTEHNEMIHVSGHAYRDEMKHMINLTQPQYFVPVHGEYRHLKEHIRLAHAQGIENDETFLLEVGDCLKLTKENAKVIGKVPHGRVLVDGKGIGDVDEEVLRDRHYLSKDGMIVVIIGLDHETGELLSGPEIVMRGFATTEEGDSMMSVETLKNIVIEEVESMDLESKTDLSTAQSQIKRALRQYIKKTNRRFPIIMPVVMEL